MYSDAYLQGVPSCILHMYEDCGHGLYEEAEDFQWYVLDFLSKNSHSGP